MFERNLISKFGSWSESTLHASFQAPTSIKIYRHGFPYVELKSINVRTDGIFVSIDQLDVTRNTYLEVEFTLKCNQNCKTLRLPVYVGCVTKDGVDLLFFESLNTNIA